jgi:hypothetical protein
VRRSLWLVPVVVAWSAGSAVAQDGHRFVERAPVQKHLGPSSQWTAGNSASVACWAVPSPSKCYTAGYVGGASLLHGNNPCARGPCVAPGPVTTGTFGWDFGGFRMRPGRVFLAPSPSGANRSVIANHYRAEDPFHVPDVFALRPFRKAVLEKHEAKEERHGGGEHAGGHGGEHGNGNGEAKPGELPPAGEKH